MRFCGRHGQLCVEKRLFAVILPVVALWRHDGSQTSNGVDAHYNHLWARKHPLKIKCNVELPNPCGAMRASQRSRAVEGARRRRYARSRQMKDVAIRECRGIKRPPRAFIGQASHESREAVRRKDGSVSSTHQKWASVFAEGFLNCPIGHRRRVICRSRACRRFNAWPRDTSRLAVQEVLHESVQTGIGCIRRARARDGVPLADRVSINGRHEFVGWEQQRHERQRWRLLTMPVLA